ncbi:hypothetical protein JR334_06520 [Clostridia bacterium]|nr:hypothetical protein JR334_06520 [Clostridia bacterium]
MKIIQVVLWALLLVLLAVLFIPFRYKIRGVSKEEKSVSVDIHWLFGLLALRGIYRHGSGFEGLIRILGIPFKVDEESLTKFGSDKRKDKKGKDTKEKNKKRKDRGTVFSVEALEYLFSSIRKVLGHVLPRSVEGYGIVGFDDPYYTGLMSAVIETMRGMGFHHMNIQYAFDREVYEGEIYMEGKLVIIYMVYIAIRLLLHKSSRNMLLGTRRKSYGI